MTRLVIITALAALLLLWSVPAYSTLPQEISDEMWMMEDPSCRSTMSCGHPQCRTCPKSGHRHAIGLPIILPHIELPCPKLPSGYGFVQRLSGDRVTPKNPMPATVPVPVGPPPSSFVGGFFMPQQYRQMPPAAYGYAMPQQYGQPNPYGQMQSAGMQSARTGYGYAQEQQAQYTQAPEQRIVYVPYAAPPPIYVQRPGQAPPRPPMLRRMHGDAKMYEYPEMPPRLYTTRGPRDFLAPHPPGIGE